MRWALAVILALTPRQVRADELVDDDAPVCEDSRPLMTGEVADCDGVLVGPRKLGGLLEDREHLGVCNVDLTLARRVGQLEREHCDARLAQVNAALTEANARLARPARWQWETAVLGLAVGLVVGAGIVFAAAR